MQEFCICEIFKQKLGSCSCAYSKYKVSALPPFYFYDVIWQENHILLTHWLRSIWATQMYFSFELFLYCFKWLWFSRPPHSSHQFHSRKKNTRLHLFMVNLYFNGISKPLKACCLHKKSRTYCVQSIKHLCSESSTNHKMNSGTRQYMLNAFITLLKSKQICFFSVVFKEAC